MQAIMINDVPLGIKEWEGHRIVTFRDIDKVHKRPEGTARDAFNRNQKHFIENEDYFLPRNWKKPAARGCMLNIQGYVRLTDMGLPGYGRNSPIPPVGIDEIYSSLASPKGITLLTESGYLMLVKTFSDDLAWKVQRELVNVYFKAKQQAIIPVTPSYDKPVKKPEKNFVDTPNNRKAQELITKLKKHMSALEVALDLSNKYLPKEDFQSYHTLIEDISSQIFIQANNFIKVPPIMIDKPAGY